jgi:hypothetical protein
MPGLVVPFAIDDEQRLCKPAAAERGKNYFCPACRESIVLRRGKIKIPHFAHKASENCNQETIVHKTAKLLVQTAIQEWKSGRGSPPTLHRACQICGVPVNQSLPEKVNGAILEYRLADGSVADVALMVGDVTQAAIEIRVTHKVDEAKARRLPVPFIEVDGYEIMENPVLWRPTIDRFRPLTCDGCKSAYARFQVKAKRIAEATGLELPTADYRYGLYRCWTCKREIIVFCWPADGMNDNTVAAREPRPRTVQYRYSETAGCKHWANTCPYCRSIQGGSYLDAEIEGPFSVLYSEPDSFRAFDRDMMRIATHAARTGLL